MEKIPRRIHVVWLQQTTQRRRQNHKIDKDDVAENKKRLEQQKQNWHRKQPELVRRCIESMRLHHAHSGWQVRLWTESDVTRENFPLVFDSLQQIESPAQRVDLLRMELLFRHGGWYVDADVYFGRSLDLLYTIDNNSSPLVRWTLVEPRSSSSMDSLRSLDSEPTHVTIVCHEDDADLHLQRSMSTSVIGSSVRNPLFALAAQRATRAKFNTANVNETTGPLLFGQCIAEMCSKETNDNAVLHTPLLIGRLPSHVFYPALWNVDSASIIDRMQKMVANDSKMEQCPTLAAHCWLASWKKSEQQQ